MSAARFRRVNDRQVTAMLYRKVQQEISCIWCTLGRTQ